MGGAFAGGSEIIDCPHDAGTEKVMPNAVDHDACREWVIRLGQPRGELHASACPGANGVGFHVVEHLQKPAFHDRSLIANLPADEHSGIRHTAVLDAHGEVGRRGLFLEIFYVRACRLDVAIEAAHSSFLVGVCLFFQRPQLPVFLLHEQ